MEKIIYMMDNGFVAEVFPSNEALESIGLESIAAKDVPKGVPYKIVEYDVDTSSFTSEKFSSPDGFGADYGMGSDWDVTEWNGTKPSILVSKDGEVRVIED